MTLSISSSSSSMHHHKWKKSLAMFSKWSPRDKKLLTPTVLAAATEKVIRHQRTSARPTTTNRPINSEDLTASQFASYAGIKIHDDDYDINDNNDDDDDDYDEDDEVLPQQVHTAMLSPEPMAVPMARSCSDRGRKAPQIWDSEFWEHETMHSTTTTTKQQQPQQPTSIMMAPARSYASTASTSSTYSALSDCSTSTNNNSSTNDVPQLVRSHPSVIRKGRFKIVLGNDEVNETPAQPEVVEWRRKRSCTN